MNFIMRFKISDSCFFIPRKLHQVSFCRVLEIPLTPITPLLPLCSLLKSACPLQRDFWHNRSNFVHHVHHVHHATSPGSNLHGLIGRKTGQAPTSPTPIPTSPRWGAGKVLVRCLWGAGEVLVRSSVPPPDPSPFLILVSPGTAPLQAWASRNSLWLYRENKLVRDAWYVYLNTEGFDLIVLYY